MRVESCTATHTGKVRTSNEDAHLADDERRVYAVADGMGGHAAGEVASKIAIEEVRRCAPLVVDSFDAPGALRIVLERAHRRILGSVRQHPNRAGMGTTLTACSFDGGLLHVAHAGDSALYLVRDGEVERLTEDQSHGHTLDNCLGVMDVAFRGAQVLSHPLLPGDVVVLATDGLTNYLADSDAAFLACVLATVPFSDLAAALVRYALAKGGEDNVTVVCARVS